MRLTNSLLGLVAAAGLALGADPALINLMMRDAKLVAGVDVQRAKNSPFGQRIVAEIKDEDRDFQKLLEATGFDPRRDLREVVMASDGAPKSDRTIVAATGAFDVAKIAKFLQAEGGTSSTYKGFELWQGKEPKHDGAIVFLSGTTALMGNAAAVRDAIDRRQTPGAGGLDAAVAAKVQEWSARNDAWFVSTVTLTNNVSGQGGGMLPQGIPLQSIEKAFAGVRFGANLEISGETVMRSDQDATALADVVRFIVNMIRLNQDQNGAQELAKIAESVQVSSAGNTMKFSFAIPEQQLERVLEKKNQRKANRSTEVI